ncbi:MAG: type II toxin-antitoxin system PemK/MazF family toxin [Candidatus Bathyarchaeota archaeon]
MKGKLVLIPFPYTDLTSSKLRPALVIHEGEQDVVVAFISSKTPGNEKTSVVVDEGYQDFNLTGLKTSSIIRLDKVATVLKSLIVGEIGETGSTLKKEVNEKLSTIYRI